MKSFEYQHVVGFEETNLVGNVYYVNLLRWQGRCRELFLKQHVPQILDDLGERLVLSTVRCSCEFLEELNAFETVLTRMSLSAMVQNRICLSFEYWRVMNGNEEIVARGDQEIACMQRRGGRLEVIPIPKALRKALERYSD